MTQNSRDGTCESPYFQNSPGDHGTMPPDPPRSFNIQASFCSQSVTIYLSRLWLLLMSYDGSFAWLPKLIFQIQPSFLQSRDSKTLIWDAEISSRVKFAETHHFSKTILHAFKLIWRFFHQSYNLHCVLNSAVWLSGASRWSKCTRAGKEFDNIGWPKWAGQWYLKIESILQFGGSVITWVDLA